MSKREKLLARLRTRPTDFTWEEAIAVMGHAGCELESNDGSRRKFIHRPTMLVHVLHEPHPQNVLKDYAIKNLIKFIDELEKQ